MVASQSDKYDWRKEWQERFPLENRNASFDDEKTNEVHVADIVIENEKCKTIVLFQNASILEEDFYKITNFYLDRDYHVAWLFNMDRDSNNYSVWDWDYTTMLKLESHLFFESGEFGIYEVLVNRKSFSSLLATKIMSVDDFIKAVNDLRTFEREQTATLETSIMFSTQLVFKPNKVVETIQNTEITKVTE